MKVPTKSEFALFLAFSLCFLGCGDCGESHVPQELKRVDAGVSDTGAATAAAIVADDPNEVACGKWILVGYQGAPGTRATRTREEAEARAREVREKVLEPNASFEDLAREFTEASGSWKRGGFFGTYRRKDFPRKYQPLLGRLYQLRPGETSNVFDALYGYAVVQRCSDTELVHIRHILITYKGAQLARPEVERSKAQARALAERVVQEARAPGADFVALARQYSEDSTKDNGGAMAPFGRGMNPEPVDDAAFALPIGQVSDPVESFLGFHVIQRLEMPND